MEQQLDILGTALPNIANQPTPAATVDNPLNQEIANNNQADQRSLDTYIRNNGTVAGTYNWFAQGAKTAVDSSSFGTAFALNWAKQEVAEKQLSDKADPAFQAQLNDKWLTENVPSSVPFSERALLKDAPNAEVFNSRKQYLVDRNQAKADLSLSPIAKGVAAYGNIAEAATTALVGMGAGALVRGATAGVRFGVAGTANVAAGAALDAGHSEYGYIDPGEFIVNAAANGVLGGFADGLHGGKAAKTIDKINTKVAGGADVRDVVKFEEAVKTTPEAKAAKAAEGAPTEPVAMRMAPEVNEVKQAAKESMQGMVEPAAIKMGPGEGVMAKAKQTVQEIVQEARGQLKALEGDAMAYHGAQEIEAQAELLLGVKKLPDGWLARGELTDVVNNVIHDRLLGTAEELRLKNSTEAATQVEGLAKGYAPTEAHRVIDMGASAASTVGHDAEAAPAFSEILNGVTPVVGRGTESYKLDFANPVDKALYLVGQAAKTSMDSRLMEELRGVFKGRTDEEIRQAGKTLHDQGVRHVLDEIPTKALPGETPTVKVPELQQFIQKKGQTALKAAVEGHIVKNFGKAVQKLLKEDRIRVVHSAEEIPGIGKDVDPAAVAGVYLPSEGRGYLVASNLTPESINGVLLHEIGVHGGLKQLLGETQFKTLLDEVTAQVAAGEEAFVKARALVKDAVDAGMTKAEDVAEETLAYLVQEAPNHSMAQKVVSLVRRAVHALSNGRLVKLTDGDYRDIALSALSGWSKVSAEGSKGAARYSVKLRLGDSEYLTHHSVFPEAGPLFSRVKRIEDNEKNLVVQHNTRADSLKLYQKLGGMPAPSVAVVKWDKPLDNFGDITLVGRKEMLDKADLYSGDAYTGRMPSTRYEFKDGSKEWKDFDTTTTEIFAKHGLGDSYRHGIRGDMQAAVEGQGVLGKESAEQALAVREATSLGLDMSKVTAALATTKKQYTAVRDALTDLVGQAKEKYRAAGNDFEKSVTEMLAPFRGEPVMWNYKKGINEPATADKVLKVMDPSRGAERESTQALTTTKFKNLEELRQAQEKLGSTPQFNAIMDAADRAVRTSREVLDDSGLSLSSEELFKEAATLGNKSWADGRELLEAIKDRFGRGDEDILKSFEENDGDLRDALDNLMETSRAAVETPREYFEAKARRVVGLHEWSHAIVPAGTDEATLKLLKDEGVKVHVLGADGDRVGKFKELAQQETDIKFSKVKQGVAEAQKAWDEGGYREAGLLKASAGTEGGAVYLPQTGKVAMSTLDIKIPLTNKGVSIPVAWAPADTLGLSEANTVRAVGDLLLVNSVGKVDEAGKGILGSNVGRGSELVQETSDTLREMWLKAHMGQVQVAANKGFTQWLAKKGIKQGIKSDFNMKLAADYDRELSDAMRGMSGVSEDTRAAAAEIQKVVKKFHGEMVALADRVGAVEESGSLLRKAADIDPSTTFMSRRWAREARLRLGAELGDEGIHAIIADSLRSKNTALSAEEADKAARSLLDTLDGFHDQAEMNLAAFAEGADDVTPRTLAARIDLDEAHEGITLTKKDGTTGKYTVRDLFENNVDRAVGSWFNTMAGIRALAHVGERINVDMTSKKAFETLIKQARREGANDKEIKLMTAAREHTLGRPTDVWMQESEVGKALRQTLTMRYGMYFAFAQMADFGNQIPRAQMKRIVDSMPGISQLKQMAKNGQPAEGVARDLANAIGTGYGHITPVLKQSIESGNAGAAYRNINLALHKVMSANGFYAVMDAVKYMSVNFQVYKLADAARGAYEFKPEEWKHFKVFGIDEATFETLKPLLNKHVKWDEHGVISSVDMDGMRKADQVAMTKLETYLYKVEQDAGSEGAGIGQTPSWMTGEFGKFIFQFQNALIVSHQRLRRDLLNFDREVAMRWMSSYMMSAASYYARSVVDSAGKPDDFDKKTQPHVVFTSAIRNTSSAGLLPNILSVASRFTPFDDPMSGATNSGRVSPNTPPLFDFLTTTQQSFKDMASATFNKDDVLTKGEAMKASRSFNPLIAVQTPLQMMMSHLPDKNLPKPHAAQ